MNTIMNQHLFRHRETKSAGFNNLCTIIHKLADEGLYAGEVVQGKRLLGTFRLTCNGKTEQSQVNINLSAFDALFRANVRGLPETNNYFVGKDGYVVLHASGHHSELYVKLSKLEKEKATPKFDSRRLGPHDMVALRLWQPGSYAVSNEPGGQKATLIVRDEDNGRYPDLTKLEPVRVTLSGKGFEPARIETWPAQALVVSIEAPAALIVQSEKPLPSKPEDGKKAAPTAAKKRKRA